MERILRDLKLPMFLVMASGLWLLAGDKEIFLPYEDFPWFKDVPIGQILNVQEPTPGHFYWPDIDVDLGLETIEHPDRFPLKAKLKHTIHSSMPNMWRKRMMGNDGINGITR